MADARADVDRQLAVRARDLELDDLGSEVVGVAVQPDLGRQPDAELVAALPAVAGRLDAERVQVVDDVAVVLVVGQVADREVHSLRSWRARDARRRARRSRSSGPRCRDRSARALPVPAPSVSRKRAARLRGVRRWSSSSAISRSRRSTGGEERGCASAVRQRVAQRRDRRRDRARGRTLSYSRKRTTGPTVGASRHGAPVGLERRRPPAAARVASLSWPSSARLGGDRDAQHPQHHVGLLDPAAGLEERAALVAQHRPVDQAPEQRAALLDLLVDRVRAGLQRGLQVVAPERQVERVERLPHLGRDHVAQRAPALAGAGDARDDRGRAVGVERQQPRDLGAARAAARSASPPRAPPRPAPAAWRR